MTERPAGAALTDAQHEVAILRFDFLRMLDELEAALKMPPKEGYKCRAGQITLEDQCDGGADVETLWNIEQADIDMLRAALSTAVAAPKDDLPELIRYWRTFPPPSNERAAADIIQKLSNELSIAEACAHVGTAPCGHSEQYCFSEDDGKNIVCLLCERASPTIQVLREPTMEQMDAALSALAPFADAALASRNAWRKADASCYELGVPKDADARADITQGQLDLAERVYDALTDGLPLDHKSPRSHFLVSVRDARQRRVEFFVRTRFGEINMNRRERAARVVEEAFEIAQAEGMSIEELEKLREYVYSKPVGEPHQEAAGLGVALLAYCAAIGVSADQVEADEVERIFSKPAQYFRDRHNIKAAAGVALRAPMEGGE